MEEKMDLIPIKVPPSLKRRLETAAEVEGTTVSVFIKNMLTMALTEEAGFTPLSAMKLQRINLWGMFSQRALSLENKMLNLVMVMNLAVRVGQKEKAEEHNKMLKDAGKEILWIDEALKLIAEGKWSKFYSYIEKGYPWRESG
ncbi:unnamed protein product [marine sediment metagenome]|uniref:Uncharacterized protein n=1 Tax=marine sediment metagenome TaxID=412755 RepID=X1H185_9ZZZZ